MLNSGATRSAKRWLGRRTLLPGALLILIILLPSVTSA